MTRLIALLELVILAGVLAFSVAATAARGAVRPETCVIGKTCNPCKTTNGRGCKPSGIG